MLGTFTMNNLEMKGLVKTWMVLECNHTQPLPYPHSLLL